MRREIKYRELKLTFVCPSCHQNGEHRNFTLLFCRGWHGLVHKCVPHVQHAYFPHSTNEIVYLWRCSCRPRRRWSIIGSIRNGVCERRTTLINFKYSLEFELKNDVTSANYSQLASLEKNCIS